MIFFNEQFEQNTDFLYKSVGRRHPLLLGAILAYFPRDFHSLLGFRGWYPLWNQHSPVNSAPHLGLMHTQFLQQGEVRSVAPILMNFSIKSILRFNKNVVGWELSDWSLWSKKQYFGFGVNYIQDDVFRFNLFCFFLLWKIFFIFASRPPKGQVVQPVFRVPGRCGPFFNEKHGLCSGGVICIYTPEH